MAKHYFTQNDYLVHIDEEYYNTLFIEGFASMMDSPSYSYKFFWLEGLVKIISMGRNKVTYEDVINEMIQNAWFVVTEYHVHLTGYYMGEARDNLERAVLRLEDISGLDSRATRDQIENALNEYKNDKQLQKFKTELTKNVPYKALSGFANVGKTQIDKGSKEDIMLAYYNAIDGNEILLPYTFGDGDRLKKEILFSDQWMEMINQNLVCILGWIQHEKLKWLQGINPEVPGLVYKLTPADEKKRKLSTVRELWDCIIELQPVIDIFTKKTVIVGGYDVDHFIPRSFLMNDELWDLMPMDSSLNSSKNNKLPDWDTYFKAFANNQFTMYESKQKNEKVRSIFEKCYKDNMYSMWASQELYKDGNSQTEFIAILDKNMRPLYDSAKRQGYRPWNRAI